MPDVLGGLLAQKAAPSILQSLQNALFPPAAAAESPLLGPIKTGEGLVHNPLGPGLLQPGAAGGGLVLPSTVASTRFPTAQGRVADPLTTRLMSGDIPAYLADTVAPHNVGLLSTYPGMSFLKGMTTGQAAHEATKRMSENMTYVFERSPKTMQDVSPEWYFGGSRLVSAWADRHGLPKQSMAAATATLSPSTNWNENVSMAERTADILFTKNKMPFSTAMADKAKEIYTKPDQVELLKQIQGKKLDQLDTPDQKAAWIRLYDETHNPSAFRTVAPDGGLGPFMTNAPDQNGNVKNSKLRWQSNENIAKAVSALESGGDMAKISPLLGKMHKVRNFYNNLMHPDIAIGSTADTHQVAAALLSPFGGSDIAVKHAMPGTPLSAEQRAQGLLASKGSDVSGFKGTYPIVEQATKMTGENIGLLPHMAQSATWEPVRQLFVNKSPEQKTIARNIWTRVDQGLLTPQRARDQIFGAAGGIREPSWMSGGLLYDPRSAKTY